MGGLLRVVVGGSVLFTATTIAGEPIMLSQSSMEPTLSAGQWVWATPKGNLWRGYHLEREDIVIAKHPEDPKKRICKRVKALPGELVYTKTMSSSLITTQLVPAGHVWLEGDNYNDSVDSRIWGPLPIGLVQGKVRWSIYPWHRI